MVRILREGGDGLFQPALRLPESAGERVASGPKVVADAFGVSEREPGREAKEILRGVIAVHSHVGLRREEVHWEELHRRGSFRVGRVDVLPALDDVERDGQR